jgi:riboflavin biosynthesis pyrimidine reductase
VALRVPGEPGELAAAEIEEHYAPPAAPWCRANFVASLDGAIELDGRSGELGDDDDHQVFSALRGLADVVLVGSGTARAEGYGPARPRPATQERRRARGQDDRPPIAVLSATARLDPGARLFTEGEADWPRPIVLTARRADPGRTGALAAVADVIVCGDDGVDLGAAMSALRDRGLHHVLCEGGPTVVTRLLAEALLDELCLTHAPVIAGPGHRLLVAGEVLPAPARLERSALLVGEAALFASYRITGGAP